MPLLPPVMSAIFPSSFLPLTPLTFICFSNLIELVQSGCNKCKQIGVYLVFMCCEHAMRSILVDLQLRVFDQLYGEQSRILNRYDLVMVAVKNQSWHINPCSIVSLIFIGFSFISIIKPDF